MMLPAAQACQRFSGVPSSLTLAQAALESGWGERAPGNNLFGIKADAAWKGKTVSFPTTEYIKGVKTAMTLKFRAYPDWSGSMLDHADFFHTNPRYHSCFSEKTGEGWARAVAKAGYATDPHYADTLIAVMRGRNMAQYDVLA
ncbi:MAG: glucosaminidase domain-containing protein [Pseudomonadota bacterium]|nr:glucosaminidase domain-containing protein [Pseudomonadota bacterium]